ncbi:MAG: DUF4124 domain-containing protein [Alcanivoracaceae bacterium]|nr:DUF4124 domain-containing protein [Alcanivoracaceae bacterium]
MSKILIIITFIFGCMSSDVFAKKKLYKWVDDKGQVHYSDQVPPDQIKKKHEELNEQGVVVEKVANARTKEEIQAEKDIKLAQIEADKLAAFKQKQRDIVIKSYTNEKEINRLKNERLAALERNIELARQSLDFQKNSKEQLLSMAADNERNGIEVSKALKSRIRTIKEKIDYQIKFIVTKEGEIEKVKDKFLNDLKIYREAVGGND